MVYLQHVSCLGNSNHTGAGRALLPIWTLFRCQSAQEIVRYHIACSEAGDYSVGIICLTPENIDAPWIYFEAGAMAMRYDRSAVVPLLLNVELPERSPLRQLHCRNLDEDGMVSLLEEISIRCGVKRRTPKQIRCLAAGAYELVKRGANGALARAEERLPLLKEGIYPKEETSYMKSRPKE